MHSGLRSVQVAIQLPVAGFGCVKIEDTDAASLEDSPNHEDEEFEYTEI